MFHYHIEGINLAILSQLAVCDSRSYLQFCWLKVLSVKSVELKKRKTNLICVILSAFLVLAILPKLEKYSLKTEALAHSSLFNHFNSYSNKQLDPCKNNNSYSISFYRTSILHWPKPAFFISALVFSQISKFVFTKNIICTVITTPSEGQK